MPLSRADNSLLKLLAPVFLPSIAGFSKSWSFLYKPAHHTWLSAPRWALLFPFGISGLHSLCSLSRFRTMWGGVIIYFILSLEHTPFWSFSFIEERCHLRVTLIRTWALSLNHHTQEVFQNGRLDSQDSAKNTEAKPSFDDGLKSSLCWDLDLRTLFSVH
jgi:hypothetical protein